jgi:uncharacterized protein (DUF433 family)
MSTNIPYLDQTQQIPAMGQSSLFDRLSRPQGYHLDELLPQVQSNIQFLQKKLSVAPARVAEAVAIDPRIMHGNPVFKGTRIPIYQIVEELADGTPLTDLTEAYPALTLDNIRHGLDFVSSLLRIFDDSEEISY